MSRYFLALADTAIDVALLAIIWALGASRGWGPIAPDNFAGSIAVFALLQVHKIKRGVRP